MEARLQRFMYDDRLTPMARIFLSEIYKYFDTPVDCEMDDIFFASLFKVSDRQVRRWREELRKFGYLKEGVNEFGKSVLTYKPEKERPKKRESELRVIYKTREGNWITNTVEAYAYFDALIFEEKNFSKETSARIRNFCFIFANSLFDERYYNLKFGNTILDVELYRFIMEHFKISFIFDTARRVISNYAKIQNLNLYVLASLVNCYKDDFERFRQGKGWFAYKQRQREEYLAKLEEMQKSFAKEEQKSYEETEKELKGEANEEMD